MYLQLLYRQALFDIANVEQIFKKQTIRTHTKCKKCSVAVFVLGIYNTEFLITALVRDNQAYRYFQMHVGN